MLSELIFNVGRSILFMGRVYRWLRRSKRGILDRARWLWAFRTLLLEAQVAVPLTGVSYSKSSSFSLVRWGTLCYVALVV